MGQLRAVHNEKLDKQDEVDKVLFEKLDSNRRLVERETDLIKKGCERDIRKVDERLQVMERKMWGIFGGLAVISFLVSVPGQQLMKQLTQPPTPATVTPVVNMV